MTEKYLVTGRAGSGKSTVAKELRRRGKNALDTDDIPGLANWIDLSTGQPTEVDPSSFVDYTEIGWNWDPEVLKAVLKKASGEIFLCGSASNDLDFFPLFNKVFALTLSSEEQRRRLQHRPDRYGKNPAMQDIIIREQHEFEVECEHRGAYLLEAQNPIERIADRIIKIVGNNE